MDIVYVLYEERENSKNCGIRGVWATREDAINQMRTLIQNNNLYSRYSQIDYERGYAESDPMYLEDAYSNYCIKQMEKR